MISYIWDMEALLSYFEAIPSLHRTLILVGGITFFWILEGMVPLFQVPYRKWKHSVPNFFFTLTTIVVNFPLAFLLLKSSDWAVENRFGILHWLPDMPLWLFVTLGVMLLDLLGAYAPHWVEHKVKPLWMVHLVHHSDHHVDTTTANRHHPLESLIRYVFTLAGVLIVGAPVGVIMLYQSLSVVFSQFNHANIRLPKGVDQALSWLIVSPDMHKVHHHYQLPFTDSNYGNIFSLWDRLFGTYRAMDVKDIVYGVDTFPDERENSSIKGLLRQPFRGYRRPTTEDHS